MKNLFLDSNIWLSLYHFSGDDLEQFSKLKELNGTILKIYIPEQTRNEVQRNRDAKIKDALMRFEKFDFTFPTFCKSYDEYGDFYQLYNELKRKHKEWCMRIRDDITNQTLPADRVISELFDLCSFVECTEEMIRSAELRYKAGNPPGKDNKFGDAINWECLLNSIPDGEDLYFISSDKDYKSVIDEQRFNLFLKEEWRKKKKAEVHFFVSLVAFFKAHVHEIELETEQHKEELIDSLRNSCNFATTHAIVAELKNTIDWSEQQIDDLCSAVINNFQVSYVLGDDDVFAFYDKLLSSTQADLENIKEIRKKIQLLKKQREDDDEGYPF